MLLHLSGLLSLFDRAAVGPRRMQRHPNTFDDGCAAGVMAAEVEFNSSLGCSPCSSFPRVLVRFNVRGRRQACATWVGAVSARAVCAGNTASTCYAAMSESVVPTGCICFIEVLTLSKKVVYDCRIGASAPRSS